MKRGEKESSTTVGIKADLVSLSLFDGRPNQKTPDTVCFHVHMRARIWHNTRMQNYCAPFLA